MRLTLQIVSWLALAATALAPLLFVAQQLSLPQTKLSMLVATIAWFATAPLWMGRAQADDELGN
jgi:hypothetical protein